MSVIAVEVGVDGVILAADGICYDYETGCVSGHVSKLIAMPHLDCVLGWTGVGDFGLAVHWEIGSLCYEEFDHLLEDFPGHCEAVHRQRFTKRGRYKATAKETQVSLVLAGWSNERDRYECYRVMSYPKETWDSVEKTMHENEPWTMLPIEGGAWCSMMPNEHALAVCGLADPEVVPDGEIAIRLVCAGRQSSGVTTDDKTGKPQRFNAGGFLQVARLQQGSILTWIGHRWAEDEIGEPVNPTLGPALPSWLNPIAIEAA